MALLSCARTNVRLEHICLEHPLQGARFSGGATARDDQNDAPEGARRPEHTEGRVRIVHTSETDVSLQAQWRM